MCDHAGATSTDAMSVPLATEPEGEPVAQPVAQPVARVPNDLPPLVDSDPDTHGEAPVNPECTNDRDDRDGTSTSGVASAESATASADGADAEDLDGLPPLVGSVGGDGGGSAEGGGAVGTDASGGPAVAAVGPRGDADDSSDNDDSDDTDPVTPPPPPPRPAATVQVQAGGAVASACASACADAAGSSRAKGRPQRSSGQDGEDTVRKRNMRRRAEARRAALEREQSLEAAIAAAAANPQEEDDWLELIDDVPNEQVMEEVRKLAQQTHVLRMQERSRRRTGATAAAVALQSADAVVVVSGSGMSTASGLPDIAASHQFRSKAGDSFVEFAMASAFCSGEVHARRTWGLWGQLYDLYKRTKPHKGFETVRDWCKRAKRGFVCYTSQFDGQFRAAGVGDEHLVEASGSIHRLQCSKPCHRDVWDVPDGFVRSLRLDPTTGMASGELPVCPKCGETARPNLRLFEDDTWVSTTVDSQMHRYEETLRALPESAKLVVVEIGVSSSSGLRCAGPLGAYSDTTALAGDLDLLDLGHDLLLGFSQGSLVQLNCSRRRLLDAAVMPGPSEGGSGDEAGEGEDVEFDYRSVAVKGPVLVGINRVQARLDKLAEHEKTHAGIPMFSDVEGGDGSYA